MTITFISLVKKEIGPRFEWLDDLRKVNCIQGLFKN